MARKQKRAIQHVQETLNLLKTRNDGYTASEILRKVGKQDSNAKTLRDSLEKNEFIDKHLYKLGLRNKYKITYRTTKKGLKLLDVINDILEAEEQLIKELKIWILNTH